jgi:NADH-quinone oxidoreductase subunit F
MQRIVSVQAFRAWQERLKGAVDPNRRVITICGGTGCTAFGSPSVQEAFRSELEKWRVADRISVKVTGCHGFCEKGPVIVILPSKVFYPNIRVEDVPEIVEKTVLRDEIIERLLYVDPVTKQRIVYDHEVPFYARQQRAVFRLNGLLDPTSLEDYVCHDGYAAAVKALSEMTPEAVVREVREAGLRGRGGAGFLTGLKWELARKAAGDVKYVICNADEGDPGAFMDRSLLEGTPHAIIEGMIIAAYAIGASRGIVYVRAEYPLAVINTRIVLDQARKAGLLGKDILGTGFDFDIEVREGAGAFVCGEESALIASLEGQRGMPRTRPPFPVEKGYNGKPTCINNVETLANVPLILQKGKDWYRSVGTEGSKGTKIFALAGKVNNTGLVEVPMGATLRQIIFEIGGGIPKDRKFKAAQMGGPSGGCLPARFLDLPIDYDSVKQIGAIMGSGGLIVMDDNTCMVDIARFFLEFTQSESCGKCVPCRVGTRHMLDILRRICAGDGRPGDIEELERLANDVKLTSLCGLGQTASNPVLTTLKYFREEYEEHIYLKKCRASACEALAPAPCSHACPAGVNVPEYLAFIADGRLDDALNVIRRRNPFVSVCGRVCDHPCESRCRRADLDEPLAIRALKRFASDHVASPEATLVPPAMGKAEVAIVGAGPAGLSCAYFLALMGRRSVVFEKHPVPGGMLSLGIPEYRLPKTILEKDINFILRHGVELRTSTSVDSIEKLRAQGFKAILLATGAQRGRSLGIEGEDLEGVVDSMELLRLRGLGITPELGKKVAVIGGGNAAIDVARSAIRLTAETAVDAARSVIRLGAEKVLILYRRTKEEMPAFKEEIDESLNEGVQIYELVAPKRIIGRDGRVAGIELIRMRLGDADDSGRPRPVPIEGSEFTLECDTIVPAVGQVPSVESAPSLKTTSSGTLATNLVTLQTSQEGVFAGGDVVTGGATIVEAIAQGQRAAVSIDRYLGGSGRLPPDVSYSVRQPTEEELAETLPRVEEPMLPVEDRIGSFCEVICTLTEAQARGEARRCLRCQLERTVSPSPAKPLETAEKT